MKRCVRTFSTIFALVLLVTGVRTGASGYWEGNVVVSKAVEGKKRIALTFDDGPHPGRTPEILDLLDQYGIKATFFVVGENAAAYPDIIQREITEGHELGNHRDTHKMLKNASSAEIEQQICSVEDRLLEIGEYRPKLLRPPGGLYNQNVLDFAQENCYTVVLWSIDTRDWAHTPSDKITDSVKKEAKNGDIVLMHDYIGGASPTLKALQKLIPYLIDEGFEFVTVSELVES